METREIKKLSVRLYGKEVGILEEYKGKMRFKYNHDAQIPLSLSLPVIKEVYPEKICKAYFGGLLPEHEETRKTLAIKYKISENNDFALLAAIGHDCAGAVTFHELNEPQVLQEFVEVKGEFLTDEELWKHIKDLPVKPYLGRRMSLAGAQEKTPVCVIDNKIALPLDGSPTTHILKPPVRRFEQSVANEYICMETARLIGLNVPKTEIRYALDTEFFLIQRYDRVEKNGKIMRLQQEDFTQALGVWVDNKYKVTFRDCFRVLNQTSRPALDKMNFISRVILNYLIGNCDAHGKNFSLVYTGNSIIFSPAYDILCTSVYDLDNTMAMKIGKAKYIQEVTQKDWQIFAKDLEVAPSLAIEELQRQINVLPDMLEQIVNKTNAEIGHKILDFVIKNCESSNKRLNFK